MRFKGLDLNLLVALDVLLWERNVSRAAERLCLSQSATSGALARLRDYFGDELLIQVGREMLVTERGRVLAERVRNTLLKIDATIVQQTDLKEALSKRTIKILASDFTTIAGISDTISKLTGEAPGLSISIEQPTDNPRVRLERGEVDLLIMPEAYVSPHHPSSSLFRDRYVVVMWSGNQKYGDVMSLDEFFDASHVTVKFPTGIPLYESWFLRHERRTRKVVLSTGSFSTVPYFIVETDRIAMMQSRLADMFMKMLPLRYAPSPVNIPELEERIQWNRFASDDVCLRWVRDRFLKEHN